jgi:hypothetical protein
VVGPTPTLESLHSQFRDSIRSATPLPDRTIRITIDKNNGDDERKISILVQQSFSQSCLTMILGLKECFSVESKDAPSLTTIKKVFDLLKTSCCVSSMEKALKDEELDVADINRSLYAKVLESTHTHAFSFHSDKAPSHLDAMIFKSVEELVRSLSQQTAIIGPLCLKLSSVTVNRIVRDVNGKISGYFTRKSSLARLLFDNFDIESESDAGILRYNEDPTKRLTGNSFSVDMTHFSLLTSDTGEESKSSHQLESGASAKSKVEKVLNISDLAVVNARNDRQVATFVGFDAKRLKVDSDSTYCLRKRDQFPPTVNSDRINYVPSPVKGKLLKNGRVVVNIPVTLQLNQLEKPSWYVLYLMYRPPCKSREPYVPPPPPDPPPIRIPHVQSATPDPKPPPGNRSRYRRYSLIIVEEERLGSRRGKSLMPT